jgi:O-antigen/teichoic acid export membrane protein
MGIIGLLQSTLSIINKGVGLGLSNSAVRDVAIAVGNNDDTEISQTTIALRRLVLLTGIIGGVFCLISSSFLSRITFSTDNYSTEFRILGVVILLNQLYAGQMVLLQGYRMLKQMAVVSILGGLASLAIAVPLYYLFGQKAIVPALVLLAFIPVISARYFVKNIRFQQLKQGWSTTLEYAKPMIQLGVSTMASGLLLLLSVWLVRIEVQQDFGVEGVGQFQAGWGVTTIYLQLVFQAMSKDYYPRLSMLADKPMEMRNLVNEQVHLSLLIGTPLLLGAIIFAPFITSILYSSEFTSAISQIQWLALGTLFKVMSWPLGFVLLALKKSFAYLITELVWALGFWLFSVYYIEQWGLDGVGIAYALNYMVYLTLVLSLIYFTIRFKYDKLSFILIGLSVITSCSVFSLVFYQPYKQYFLIALGILIFLTIFYLIKLNRLTGSVSTLLKKFK